MPRDTIVYKDEPADARKVKLRSKSITDKAFMSLSIAIQASLPHCQQPITTNTTANTRLTSQKPQVICSSTQWLKTSSRTEL